MTTSFLARSGRGSPQAAITIATALASAMARPGYPEDPVAFALTWRYFLPAPPSPRWPLSKRWPFMDDKTITDDTPKNVSRRNFIKGVIASGAVVSSAAYLWRSSSVLGQQPSAPGSVERLITLTVNGQERRVDVLKQETLATTLRYKLGLTGTKLGCDRAECGACTVLVDDVPHYSCSILTHAVRGKQIVTIEGLAAAAGTRPPPRAE